MKSASTIHRMPKPDANKGALPQGLSRMSEDIGVLPADAVQRLQQAGTKRIWKPHEVLYYAGSAPTAVFLVCTGRLRFRQFDSEGRERILGWAKPACPSPSPISHRGWTSSPTSDRRWSGSRAHACSTCSGRSPKPGWRS
jgi:hypothetical protein